MPALAPAPAPPHTPVLILNDDDEKDDVANEGADVFFSDAVRRFPVFLAAWLVSKKK